jgi:hypothetical protein
VRGVPINMKRTLTSLGCATIAAAVGFGATAVAQQLGAPDSAVAPHAPQFAPAARGALGRLSQPARSTDAVDAAVRTGPLLADGFANPAEARRLAVPGTRPAWVMPGAEQTVCYVTPGAMNCPEGSELSQTGAAPFVHWRANEPYRVEGLAADDVPSVVLWTSDGAQQAAGVSDNAFRFTTASRPVKLTWDYRGESQTYEFYMPPAGAP